MSVSYINVFLNIVQNPYWLFKDAPTDELHFLVTFDTGKSFSSVTQFKTTIIFFVQIPITIRHTWSYSSNSKGRSLTYIQGTLFDLLKPLTWWCIVDFRSELSLDTILCSPGNPKSFTVMAQCSSLEKRQRVIVQEITLLYMWFNNLSL